MNEKKKFSKWIMIVGVLVIALAAIIIFVLTKNDKGTLALDQFKNAEDKYQYADIAWDSSLEEVQKKLPYAIEAYTELGELPEGMAYYKTKNDVKLDGKSGKAVFEFKDGQLNLVTFEFGFEKTEDYKKWFDAQIEVLRKNYGKESDMVENSSEELGMEVIGYKWMGDDDTMLQSDLIKSNKVTVRIAVGKLTAR